MRISFSNISVVNPTNRRIKPHHILSFVYRNGYKPVHVKDGDLVLVAGPIFEGDDLGLPLFARNLNAKINLLPIRVQEMTSKNLALRTMPEVCEGRFGYSDAFAKPAKNICHELNQP